MADNINAMKRKQQPVMKEAIDQLILALRGLKEQDQGSYEQLLQRLREDLLAASGAAHPPAPEPHDT